MHQPSANGISIRQLSKKQTGNVALDQFSLFIPFNKKTVIVGETGAGKSTLLKLIAGLEQPDSGTLYYGTERIKGADEQLIPGHQQIAYLSQYAELRNNYKISEVLDYDNQLSQAESEEIYSICDIVHLIHRWSDELSGGEKQRVAIAKMLTKKPKVILLDEPFSHLDHIHKQTIKKIFDKVFIQMDVTFIMVTHDARDAFGWADEMHVLHNGQLIQSGEPDHLFHQPINAYVAGLLGDFYLIQSSEAEFLVEFFEKGREEGSILLRPGYFIPDQQHGFKVSVLDCKFKGDYYELLVKKNKMQFSIYVSNIDSIDFDNLKISYQRHALHRLKNAE